MLKKGRFGNERKQIMKKIILYLILAMLSSCSSLKKYDSSLLLYEWHIYNADRTVNFIQYKLKDTVKNFILLEQNTFNSRVYKSDDAYPLRSVQYLFTFKKGELEILRFTDYEECKFLKLNNIDLVYDLKDILNRISTGATVKHSFSTILDLESTLLINWNDTNIVFDTLEENYQAKNEIYYILIEKLQ